MDFIPSDNDAATKHFKADKGGCCGQACLAVIERLSIKEVFKNWVSLGIEWKGYSTWKQLRFYLIKRGFVVKQKNNLLPDKMDIDKYYLLRIQWLGLGKIKDKPFYGYGHWSIASANTHFIIGVNNKFFCNETGWITDLKKYLSIKPRGIITSYYEIKRKASICYCTAARECRFCKSRRETQIPKSI